MGFDTVPTGIATGTAGSLLNAPVVNAIAGAGGLLVIPVGVYFFYAVGANIQVQVFDGATWQNLTAVGVGGMIYSDGVSVRFINGAVGSQNVTTVKIG